MKELKTALASERGKTGRLMRVIEQKVLEQKTIEADPATIKSGRSNRRSSTERGHASGEGRNPVTVQECESIIARLQGKLDQKAHEVC